MPWDIIASQHKDKVKRRRGKERFLNFLSTAELLSAFAVAAIFAVVCTLVAK